MKQYVNQIRNAGIVMLVITFFITTLWGSDNAFFPFLVCAILLAISVGYKALHWNEYKNDNKRNMYIALFIVAYMFMFTVFGF